MLPATGGEASAVTRLLGGVSEIAATARGSDAVVIAADLLPSADSLETDATARAERTTKKITANLHESYPVRYWDHDLTPRPGRSADTGGQGLTPDGRTLIVSLRVQEHRAGRFIIVSIDVESGTMITLIEKEGVEFEVPAVSRDGRRIAFVRAAFSTPSGPADQELCVADIDSGNGRRVAEGGDRWPSSLIFDAHDEAPIVTADQDGRGPVFRVPLDGGSPIQLTTDDFSYTDVAVDVDTGDLVALRSSWVTPPHPVRIARSGVITPLATPAWLPEVPGSITEAQTTVEDGAGVSGWLLLPEDASPGHPAPLLYGAAARSGFTYRLWSRLHRPRLGCLGSLGS